MRRALLTAAALTGCVALAPHLFAQPSPAVAPATESASATPSVPNGDAKVAQAFAADCLAKARAADKTYQVTIPGKNGWLFFAPELRHVGIGRFWGADAVKASQATIPDNADPLPAILDFKAQLDKAGIELLLVPVPPKAVIFPDMASNKVTWRGPARFDPLHQEFYALLRESGVSVLDLTPEFLQGRSAPSGALYCQQDTHWSGRACVLAAQRIKAELAGRPWLAALKPHKYESEWKRIKIDGDLRAGLSGKLPPLETLPLRFVGTRAKPGQPLKPIPTDRNSPIVLLGDSHDLVFHEGGDMHAVGAGLPDQLALELGVPVDLIAVRGSGATPARVDLMRRARANPKYLSGKKLVVWCFSAREFTETAGWRKVPVVAAGASTNGTAGG